MRKPAASNDNTRNAAGPQMREAAALLESGRVKEAEELCRSFLKIHPQDPDLHNLMGAVMMKQKNYAEAIPCFHKALEIVPTLVSFYLNLSIALRQGKRAAEAVPILKRAMQQWPDNPEVYLHLGHTARSLENLVDARSCYEQAIALSPTHQQAWFYLGHVYELLGDFPQAVAGYTKAITLNPADRRALYYRAFCLLTMGDFKTGFQHYELRWVQDDMPTLPSGLGGRRMWDSAPMKGTLLVLREQGMGDVIQCLRFLPLIKEKVGRLVVQVPESLHALVKRMNVADEIIPPDALPECDSFIPFLSLPRVLAVDEAALVATNAPYLRADAERLAKWQERMKAPGKKVGLVWRGASGHTNDHNRSMSLVILARLLQRKDITFYSLQKGAGEDELAAFSNHRNLIPLGAEIKDYDDTAAILKQLDVLISVDTSVVHLAGALGVKSWLMVPYVPDWRWMLNREDSPWYPSLRLFRQPQRKAWAPVIARLNEELQKL